MFFMELSMLFELTNMQRQYLGLTQVEESWEKIKFNDEIYLYFSSDKLVKQITIAEDNYLEIELNETTANNRTTILPKTPRGKAKKLSYTALSTMNGVGVYFHFARGHVTIANFSTQTTFYSSYDYKQGEIKGLEGLKEWLNGWVDDTTEEDLKDIERFKSAKRQHCKYREGDFFAFKTGRRQYGFGRILLDVSRIREAIKKGIVKEKHYGLTTFMGKPLIIKVYKKTSDSIDVNLSELKQCEAFLSLPVMDNNYYYGEYKILGNMPLESFELDFPISYSRSINATDPDTVYLQYGLIYMETDISRYSRYLQDPLKEGLEAENPFRCGSLGYGILPRNEASDLRSQKNKKIKQEIFAFFGLDANKSYHENYEIYLGLDEHRFSGKINKTTEDE
jgi:hypothetical protein